MSIRVKTILLIVGSTLILLLVSSLITTIIFTHRFTELEKQDVIQNSGKIENLIQSELQEMERTNEDWAMWDDSYLFAAGEYPDYWQDNWAISTYKTLQLKFIAYVDLDGKIIRAEGADYLRGQFTNFPEEMQQYLNKESGLLDVLTPKQTIIALPQGAFLIVSHAITHSDGSGPANGFLILAREIDPVLLEKFSSMTNLSVHLLSSQTNRSNFDRLLRLKPKDANVLIQLGSAEIISGFLFINGINKDPEIIFQFDHPRDIFQQGRASLFYVITISSIFGIGLTLLYILLFERQVIRPLGKLRKELFYPSELSEIDRGEKPLRRISLDALEDIKHPLEKVLLEARTKSQKALIQQEIYFNLVNQAKEGFALIEPENLSVLDANPAFFDFFEIKGKAKKGLNFEELLWKIISKEKTVEVVKKIRVIQENKPGFITELETKSKTGISKIVDLSINSLKINDQILIYMFIRDMSERKLMEKQLQYQLDETLIINRILSAATSSFDSKAIYNVICKEFARALNVPQTSMGLADAEKSKINMVAEYGNNRRPSILGEVFEFNNNPVFLEAIRHKQPIAVNDAQNDPALISFRPILKRIGIISILILPLIIHEDVIGTVLLGSLAPRKFTEEEVETAVRISLVACQSVEILRLYEEVQNELGHRKAVEHTLEKENDTWQRLSKFNRYC